MSSNMIVLTSSDNHTFEIEEAVARELQIIAHMIDDDCADKPIPIQNVTGEILAKVIEYCKKHVEAAGSSEEEDKDEDKAKELKAWDTEFIKVEIETVFQIILAANYLNVKGLLDLTSQTIADYIKDKSVEEVREIFNIDNDYTKEEEEAVRKENAWAFE